MKVMFSYDESVGVLTSTVSGDLSFDDVKTLVDLVNVELEKHNCEKIINDFRDSSFKLSILEIHDLPEMMFASGMKRTLKRAMVIKEIKGAYYFFETVAKNRGHILKLFTDIEKAKTWLG